MGLRSCSAVDENLQLTLCHSPLIHVRDNFLTGAETLLVFKYNRNKYSRFLICPLMVGPVKFSMTHSGTELEVVDRDRASQVLFVYSHPAQ